MRWEQDDFLNSAFPLLIYSLCIISFSWAKNTNSVVAWFIFGALSLLFMTACQLVGR